MSKKKCFKKGVDKGIKFCLLGLSPICAAGLVSATKHAFVFGGVDVQVTRFVTGSMVFFYLLWLLWFGFGYMKKVVED